MTFTFQTFIQLIGNKTVFNIIAYLHGIGMALTGRKIATMLGLSHYAVNTALMRLQTLGLVDAQQAGRAFLYTLNRDHMLIQHGFNQFFHTLRHWREEIGAYYMERLPTKPQAIILFGSAARGEMTEKSDLDLLFVYDAREGVEARLDEVLALNQMIHRLWGLAPVPLVMSALQFRAGARETAGLIPTLVKEGVSIAGVTVTELLYPV